MDEPLQPWDENQTLLNQMHEGVYLVDRERRIRFWNRGAERISGYTPEQVFGRSCANNLLMHMDESGKILCRDGCPLAATMQDGEMRETQVYLHHSDGQRVPVLVRAAPLRDEQGEIVGAIETFTDNSALLDALHRLQQLHQAAWTDPLTGLSNRRLMEVKLGSALFELRRHNIPCGLLFIDVDYFKDVNDRFGHQGGDDALQMVASTLRLNLRVADLICRWGGDEFLVLLSGAEEGTIQPLADKLRMLVSAAQLPGVNGSGPLQVTVSIGATGARPEDKPAELLARADRLLYQSKREGRNRVSFG